MIKKAGKKKLKKFISLLLAFAFALALAGCQNNTETSSPSSGQNSQNAGKANTTSAESSTDSAAEAFDNTDTSGEPQTSSGSKTLVVYFSRTGEQYTVGTIDKGNTEIVAEMIAEKTGSDLYEILPETDYPYTYSALTDVAKKEQNEKARPKIKGSLPDVSKYDTVFVGAPVWWGDWPMICYTFFENVDLSGKKLVPFSTHEGSGLSGFDRKLASAVPDATVLTGQAFRGNDCQNKQADVRATVNKWIEGLNLGG